MSKDNDTILKSFVQASLVLIGIIIVSFFGVWFVAYGFEQLILKGAN